MRLPYLQVDQDALVRARTMARLLAVPEAHGVGLAVSLFAWGLEMAPDGDLSGGLPADRPDEMVAAAVGWDREPSKLYSAMVRVGFIEAPDDDFDRIRGLNRYEAVLDERKKDRERKAASRKASAHLSAGLPPDIRVTPTESTRKTQTQTQTHREAFTLSPKASADAPADPVAWQDRLFKPGHQPPKRPPKAEKVPDPRHAPMVKRLTEAFQKARSGIKYGFTGRDANALTRLLAMGSDDEIEVRWLRAMRNTGFPVVRSLGELVTHWNHFAADSPVNTKAPVRAEDIPKESFAVKGEISDF